MLWSSKPMVLSNRQSLLSFRRRLNFTFQGLEDAGRKLEKIHSILERLRKTNGEGDAEKMSMKAMKKFEHAMDDNLNTGKALKVMEEFTDDVSRMNPCKESSEKIFEIYKIFDSILGLELFGKSS
jgi:cysteinyl-tRNA synthetase